MPTAGAGLSTVLVTAMSAAGGPFTTAAATSLLVSGSGWSLAVIAARFVTSPATFSVATRVSVADWPASTVPTVHFPVAGT